MLALSRLTLLALSLMLAVEGQSDTTYDLIWRPRANDQMTYKLHVDIESTPDKFTFTEDLKIRVVKVKPNGDYDVETTTKSGHVIHGNHDEPIADDNKAPVDTYNSRGQKIASSEDNDPSEESNPGFNTLDAVTDQLSPKNPVAIGASWLAHIKANAKQKREAARVSYTLIGKVKQGTYQTYRVDFNYRETEKQIPVTASGYMLLSQNDYSLVRFEGTIKGAHFSDDPEFPNGAATLSLVRD